MLPITPINAAAEPKLDRPAAGANPSKANKVSEQGDAVQFSGEAKQAATAAELVEATRNSEIRKERVEQARRNIEQGSYRMQEVVSMVATSLTNFM